MTIYSLYIFDRHCTCVYYQDWHRTKRPKPATKDSILPAVSRAIAYRAPGENATDYSSHRSTLQSMSGIVVAVGEDEPGMTGPLANVHGSASSASTSGQMSALPFDEEAKLVYGVILSLRTMVKKLSKRDEQFTSYRTSTYKLHVFETVSGYKFVMLTDPKADSTSSSPMPVRFVLRQIYAGPFLDYVVRNPLVSMDSKTHGIDNDYFRASIDRLIRGLSIFQ